MVDYWKIDVPYFLKSKRDIIFYDTEFHERLDLPYTPIECISIALVNVVTKEELVLVNGETDWDAIANNPDNFLTDNVVPYVDKSREMSRDDMKQELLKFLKPRGSRKSPRLWVNCGAYDHVVLAQSLGSMNDYPSWLNYYTEDLQSLENLVPKQIVKYAKEQAKGLPGVEHDPLRDAHEVRVRHAHAANYLYRMIC